MKIGTRILYTIIAILLIHTGVFAQMKTLKPVKVAVFAPLYINDAFDGYDYKLGKNSLPKHILPGLEFYNGVMMAIDSLEQDGVRADISIYDLKNPAEVSRVLTGSELNNTGVIIAAFTNTTELKNLANVAAQKKIPLISATYPNSGSTSSNPYFVLLNSSLQAHLEGLYKYMQRSFAMENIIFVKRPGSVENYIKTFFTNLNKKTTSLPLKMKWVELTDTFYNYQLTKYLDSTKRNVVVVASPNEEFGLRVAKNIDEAEIYSSTIVGMPTWDGIRDMNNSSLKNVEIVYSTPFRYTSGITSAINNSYRAKYSSRPSDMVFRGYESLFHFTHLLLKHRENLISNLSDTEYTLFNQFDIQPVKLKSDGKIDYYENKKLYFIKKQQGEVIAVSNY